MRPQFIQALMRPLDDIEVAGHTLEQFYRPIEILRVVEAQADRAERALEALSLGLGLAEIYVRAAEEEDEP